MSLLVAGVPALGNDGFYQGSGFAVFPVNAAGVRVIREKLLLEPMTPRKCYTLIGVAAKAKDRCYSAMKLKELPDCPKKSGDLGGEVFSPEWRARAEYEVVADHDIASVQMGFPIPDWDYSFGCDKGGGRENASVDGITEFRMWQDGKEHTPLRRRRLQAVPTRLNPRGTESYDGYIWQASFKRGQRTSLTSEYAFGVMYNAEFFGRDRRPNDHGEYQSVAHYGERPWFEPAPDAKASCGVGAASVDYILSPINLWGNEPPDEIRIELRTGAVPTRFWVPYYPAPRCVERHKMVFVFPKSRPQGEFRASYPVFLSQACSEEQKSAFFKRKITSIAEWRAWLTTLGTSAGFLTFTCDLLADVKAGASPELVEEIKRHEASCKLACE